MTTGALAIGTFVEGGGRMEIPLEGVTKAYAITGIRESGKSSLATVMAEEYCRLRQPWIAFDPAGNWWGLRARPDGRPGGFPVVVFGGERGDLPLDKGSGRRIAEVVTAENVFAVVDLKLTSKTTWRTLVRDIVGGLQEIQPRVPRMVFLEEAQEFIPQRPSHQLGAECKEIVERLVTLGGNWGYGATILGQRPASIEKSALSQCETVFVFATQGSQDRDAYKAWIRSQEVREIGAEVLAELANLEAGTCWCWSPRFLKAFAKVRVRRRETFHPRDARRLGVSVRDVELAPVDEFVAKARALLTKAQAAVTADLSSARRKGKQDPKGEAPTAAADSGAGRGESGPPEGSPAIEGVPREELRRREEALSCEIDRLQKELAGERGRRAEAQRRLEAVREQLRPQYDALARLFGDLGAENGQAEAARDRAAWEHWLLKAGKRGCRRMLETLVDRGELTRVQLGTLAGIGYKTGTFRTHLSWLRSNGLIEESGDVIRLRAV